LRALHQLFLNKKKTRAVIVPVHVNMHRCAQHLTFLQIRVAAPSEGSAAGQPRPLVRAGSIPNSPASSRRSNSRSRPADAQRPATPEAALHMVCAISGTVNSPTLDFKYDNTKAAQPFLVLFMWFSVRCMHGACFNSSTDRRTLGTLNTVDQWRVSSCSSIRSGCGRKGGHRHQRQRGGGGRGPTTESDSLSSLTKSAR
jgi:hypothetical protein